MSIGNKRQTIRGDFQHRVVGGDLDDLLKDRTKCPVTVKVHGKDDASLPIWLAMGVSCQQVSKKELDKEEFPYGETTDEQDKATPDVYRIVRVEHREQDLSNPLSVTLVHEHELTSLPPKELLKTGTVSIGLTPTEVYVWQRIRTTTIARRVANILAAEYRRRTHAVLMLQTSVGSEFILFKEKFSNYPGMLPIRMGVCRRKSATTSVVRRNQ